MKRKVIIDTDPGTDDAKAILMALHQENWEVLGITLVAGNCKVHYQVDNISRLLTLVNRTEVPVYKGSECSLLGDHDLQTGYHGIDGFGDVFPHPADTNMSMIQQEHAVSAIIRLVKENPGEVTLIAIGPLTNLALAVRMEPSLGSQMKDCFIMGGNIYGVGNRSVGAEFNFYCDPEAAHIVLNELKCPITIAPLEMCKKVHLPWETYTKMFDSKSKIGKFVLDIDNVVVDRNMSSQEKRTIIYDECAIGAAIDDDIIDEKIHRYATVELNGKHTRGQMIVDWNNTLDKQPNCTIITAMNLQKLTSIMVDRLS